MAQVTEPDVCQTCVAPDAVQGIEQPGEWTAAEGRGEDVADFAVDVGSNTSHT